jgi:hypothetical protein
MQQCKMRHRASFSFWPWLSTSMLTVLLFSAIELAIGNCQSAIRSTDNPPSTPPAAAVPVCHGRRNYLGAKVM